MSAPDDAYVDFYDVLQSNQQDDLSSIRSQYRRLAFLYHPDRNSSRDSAKKFELVQQAWTVLRDPQKRQEYDQQYKEMKQRGRIVAAQGYISDKRQLSGLQIDEARGTLYCECRCSGRYEIPANLISTDSDDENDGTVSNDDDAADSEQLSQFVVQCSGCSLRICIENDLLQDQLYPHCICNST